MATYEERAKKTPLPDVNFPHIPSPYIRTALTDVFGSVVNHQTYHECGPFELNMMECLEAYGLDKGRKNCSDYIDDFNECRMKTKQFLRIRAMELERNRQFKSGEIKEKYAPPPDPRAY